MIGRVLWDEFFSNRDWPVASAVAIALLLLLVLPIMVFQRYQAPRQAEAARDEPEPLDLFLLSALVFGFAFLYIPILSVIVLLVQRIAARHGVGRVLDPVVRRAVRRPADARWRVA